MKYTYITCDNCGSNVPNSTGASIMRYTENRKVFSEMHLCNRCCDILLPLKREGDTQPNAVVDKCQSHIWFSHDYPKLHKQTSAKLIMVMPIIIDDNTPKELIEYDTKYDGGYFELPHGTYVHMIFVGNLGIPFCTIRKSYPASKGDYYCGVIGDVFDIKVKTDGDKVSQNRVEISKKHLTPKVKNNKKTCCEE